MHWGRRLIQILEFTRLGCNDYPGRSDWRETTEEYKTDRYQPLRDKMAGALPVEIVNFTLGIRGSYAETRWTAALTALGVSEAGALVTHWVTELNELDSTRAAALQQRVDAHQEH